MKIVFAGTSPFAATALEALCASTHHVALVWTRPDRPAGRGLHTQASAVKEVALNRRLPLEQPPDLKGPDAHDALARLAPDALIVAAYGHLVPASLLAIPPHGGINIHASLLPRWRGAAPIHRAILAGDRETGITIMQMDAGLDTGPILVRESVTIRSDDTTGTLHDRLARLGGELIVRALTELPAPQPQDTTLATYAAKVEKREAAIDWNRAATDIDRQVRAFNPAPGAATSLNGILLKIWRAEPIAGDGTPGTILRIDAATLDVACGNGALRISELQPAGAKRMSAAAFLAGRRVNAGVRLGD